MSQVKGMLFLGLCVTPLLLSGCGASTALRGSLSSLQSFAPLNPRAILLGVPRGRAKHLQTGSATTVTCVTAGNPPTKVSGSVASSGTFSVDLKTVLDEPLTCTLLDASDAIVGTFLFQNSSQKGFGGDSQQIDTVSLSSGVDVGEVEISGSQIAVDASTVGITTTGAAVTADSAFDPTGIWEMGNVDFTLPPGYSNPCDPGDATCHGPQSGGTIYIKRVVGKAFTPDSTCQAAVDNQTYAGGACGGTTGTEDNFAFTIWMAKSTFLACGDSTTGAVGFTENQAKAYGHIDLSSDTSTLHQAFAWTTAGPAASTIASGWKSSAATANWDINSCNPVTIGGKSVYKCLDGAGHYSLSYGGGCTDSMGDNIQPDSWSHVDFAGGSCSQSTTTVGTVNLTENACTVSYTPTGGSAQTIHCGGAYGTFNVADDSAYVGTVTPAAIISSGAACSTLVTGGDDSKELSKLQCYANYYYQTLQNTARSTPTYCLRDIRTNWGATTSSDFINNDGPGHPVNQALTEKVTYLSDDVATLTQMEDEYAGLQVTSKNGSAWVPCHTVKKNSITMTKVDSTHMVIKFVSETHLADDKIACQAAAADTTSAAYSQLQLGTSRMLFKMTKTGT